MKTNDIRTLFRKLEEKHQAEFDNDNWIEFHSNKKNKGGMLALRQSLKLIGDGEITTRSEEHLMYKQMLNNNTRILVVHARFSRSPYGGAKGYYYEIGVYANDPRLSQIGGGYGTSGTVTIKHTQLLGYSDYDMIHYNRKVISKVCKHIIKYTIDNL